jgi:PST family polysaccharide transporter
MQLFRHRVATNAIAMAIVPLVNYAASFVVLIRLTRILSVETYGVVAFSVGIVQVFAIILDLGFTLSATQKISVFRDNRNFVSRLTGAVLLTKLAAFLAGVCIICAYAVVTQKYAAYSALLMLTLIPLLGHALQPLWFFSGIERMRFMTLFIVLAKLTFVATIWLMVSSEKDYLWVPIADGIAQLSAAIVALWLIHYLGYRVALPRRREVRYAVRMTSGFCLSRLSATASSYSGVVVLGLAADASSVATYSLAEQLYRAMHALFAPVVQSLYPYMARERNLVLLWWVTLACTAVALVGAIAGHFLAPLIFSAMFGAKWSRALPVFDVFLAAITLHVLAMMSGYPLAAAVNRTDVVNSAVNCAAILYMLIASVFLIAASATPRVLAWLVLVTEGYVLSHCAVVLWPMAKRQYHGEVIYEKG